MWSRSSALPDAAILTFPDLPTSIERPWRKSWAEFFCFTAFT